MDTMKELLTSAICLTVLASLVNVQAQEARIAVQAHQEVRHVSPYLTGACIEDVNHEIYGGIYSQMVFGESFQEPAPTEIKTFRAFGGAWRVSGTELQFSGAAGGKLVSELPAFTDGEVGVEMYIPDRRCTNAGLIVRVDKPGKGANNFDGYEIALNAAEQYVRLGRHRHNWEPITDTPCDVPTGQWVGLAVKLTGRTIEITVNGKSILRYEDSSAALLSGTIGLRQFQREAQYRKLWVKMGGEEKMLAFESASDAQLEVSGMWLPVRRGGATGALTIEKDSTFVGQQSQRLAFFRGNGEIGVENQGLNRWGMHFVGGKPYEGILWARAEEPVELFVSLECKEGQRVLAETRLSVKAGDWQRLTFTLRPKITARSGSLALTLRTPGSVVLGYVFLQPGSWGRFKGLPARRDVARGLLSQGITVLRYGGSMINHPAYRWKNMIGPRDRRPPYTGTWYPYSSNGWGILDFLDFCEAAGFLGIPAFNMDETPQDMAHFIEYVNGPRTSEWGRRRASDGHPAPYNLRHLELGNEERVDENYYRKFKPLAEAIWNQNPRIIIVVGDFCYQEPIRDPFDFRGSCSGITSLAAQREILQLARQHDREVWFDLHVGTDGPRPDSTLAGMFSFIDALDRIAGGARFKVAVFELNAGNHTQSRALANALALNAVGRDGRVPVVTSANCLQPDGQNDNGWDQGLLFLDQSHVWLQAPGYITQMYSRNYLPRLVRCQVTTGENMFDVNAERSNDGRTLILQAVNPTDRTVSAQIHLVGFVLTRPVAQVIELSGPLGAVNTAGQPDIIIPHRREWKHAIKDGDTRYTFPPYSVTMLRLE